MLVLVINALMMYSLVTSTDGYSVGAPLAACNSMSPSGHGVPAQTSPSPYTVTPSTTAYTSGDSINVTLSGGTFKGFLCQARPDVNSDTTVGTLVESDGSSLTTNQCGAGSASLTQNSGAEKTSIQFTWTPSENSTGDIYFVCTVIQSKTVFWEKVNSSKPSSGGQIIPSVILMFVCIAFGVFQTPFWRQ